jgi:glutathione-regulated potassium-efflux system ancillary protein KefG
MRYLAPFVVHGTHKLGAPELTASAEDYRRLLIALRDNRLDLDKAETVTRINSDLGALIKQEQS